MRIAAPQTESVRSLKTFTERHVPISKIKVSAQPAWAWEHYTATVRNLIAHFSLRVVMEIGGGRFPLFTREDVDALGIEFAVNDISQRELDLGPEWLHKVCFDVVGSTVPESEENRYDLVISKMVMEHVKDGRQAYRNVHRLLKRGGIFFHFFPVLYSPPFVANRLLPEAISRKVLEAAFPGRNDNEFPKFPAHYSCCTISPRTEAMLFDTGFREVELVPVYGHDYFRKLPGLRELDSALSDLAYRRGWRRLASYCYAFGRK
ncbi:MAG: methyltransferase domain-containing protein [Phycisphaerae bacterium]|nr:methyltransferase domain-containing protein [Phycisphaerae bacterium]